MNRPRPATGIKARAAAFRSFVAMILLRSLALALALALDVGATRPVVDVVRRSLIVNGLPASSAAAASSSAASAATADQGLAASVVRVRGYATQWFLIFQTGRTLSWTCSGVLVGAQVVATAAHCLSGDPSLPAYDTVEVDLVTPDGSETIGVAHWTTSPSWDPSSPVLVEHDVAALLLQSTSKYGAVWPLNATASSALPASTLGSVPTADVAQFAVSACAAPVSAAGNGIVYTPACVVAVALGYGSEQQTTIGGGAAPVYPSAPQFANLAAFRDVGGFFAPAGTLVTAPYDSSGGGYPCFGDSGGPLIAPVDASGAAFALVGLLSSVDGPAVQCQGVNAYVDVGEHVDFFAGLAGPWGSAGAVQLAS